MKILIIEDEKELRLTLRQFLEQEHFLVETAKDYPSGLAKLADYDYDCILLDIMLPNGSGMQLLDELRAMKKNHSVLIISAKDSVEDKVLGLEKGADDYLAKPFHLAELLARVKSIIRRKNQQGEEVITLKNVQLFPETRTVKVGDTTLTLNRKEYVWGDYIDQVDSLDFIYSQIKNLRKKLKTAEAEIDLQAVYGIGYKLV